MADKFRNKYRIPSAQLRSWNYGSSGLYFITICTHNRECFFGKIINGEMHLNEIGEIAEQQWINTPEMRPDMNLELDAFVIMPGNMNFRYSRTHLMSPQCKLIVACGVGVVMEFRPVGTLNKMISFVPANCDDFPLHHAHND